ncbi:MAG: cyclic nucleotide-binding domain-containing protein [Anaerolineales bacterium]|nr:MAG: cyclic nucleotide-binding domain-containing protein [Anaerolineales bacterium]
MISPETLRRYPYFAGITEKCMRSVALLAEENIFKQGEVIFTERGEFLASDRIYQEGEQAKHLMLITEGEIDIALTFSAEKQVVVGTLGPGELMALSALIPPYLLTASAIASTDGKMICFESEDLRRLMDDNPELGYPLMSGVAKALRDRLKNTRIELSGSL